MANQVYANMMEVSCKQASGKSICAFPDVCFTPPQTPATPPGVPIPYPNTGMASDCTDGSRSVKISGQEVMLKNKSYFKKSTGDEAGSAPKKGIMTSKITGKVYFTMWSMDVKVEGENVVRHLDLTTHNHGSNPNTAPWTYADRMAMAKGVDACEGEVNEVKDKCGEPLDRKATCPPQSAQITQASRDLRNLRKQGNQAAIDAKADEVKGLQARLRKAVIDDPCQKALQCFLSPYKPSRCCPGQTPDHLIEVSSFLDRENSETGVSRSKAKRIAGWKKYDDHKAPCACAEGGATTLTHGILSVRRGVAADEFATANSTTTWSMDDAAKNGAKAFKSTFKYSKCSDACIEGQLKKGHEKFQDDPENAQPIKIASYKTSNPAWQRSAQMVMGLKARASAG